MDARGLKNGRQGLKSCVSQQPCQILLNKLFDLRSRSNRKNDRNGGIWQSGISKSLAEYVQRPVCFINVQSSLHENVVFSVCARMYNAAYFILSCGILFPV